MFNEAHSLFFLNNRDKTKWRT